MKRGNIEFLDYYNALGYIKQLFAKEAPQYMHSLFVYGSVGRFEVFPGSSDLDLIGVLKEGETPSGDDLLQLNRMIGNIVSNNKNIRTSIHLWNRDDLHERTAGIEDKGLTIALNKFRDKIVLYGDSFDSDFIQYFNNIRGNTPEIITDFFDKLSKSRYGLRRLVNKVDGNDVVGHQLEFSIGKALRVFAQEICYMNGYYFLNVKDAEIFADKKTESNVFKNSFSLKTNGGIADLFNLCSWVDNRLGDYFKKLSTSKSEITSNVDKLVDKANTFQEYTCDQSISNQSHFESLMRNKNITEESIVARLYEILSNNALTFKIMPEHGNFLNLSNQKIKG